MRKLRAAIVALGLAVGFISGAVAAQKISIHCEYCRCNADLTVCECTNCTLTTTTE